MNVGFVVAMDSECSPFLRRLGDLVESQVVAGIEFCSYVYESKRIFLAKCGIGEVAAAAATALLIGKFSCSYIVNFGLVGSFVPEYRGRLVAVRDVVHYESDLTPFGHPLGAPADFSSPFIPADDNRSSLFSSFDLPLVRLASGDKFIADPVFSEKIKSDFSADICDMEGAAIAIVCARSKVPFSMIKLVSDGADSDASEDFAESKVRSFGRAFDVVFSLIKEV